MVKLELLWRLEDHKNSLGDLENQLAMVNKNLELNDLKEKIGQIRKQLDNYEADLEDHKKDIRKKDLELKSFEYEMGRIDKNLYEGKISDLKELDYLSKEREKYSLDNDKLETELIDLMLEVEAKELEMVQFRLKIEELEKKKILLDQDLEKKKTSLDEEISSEKDKIDELSSSIDREVLDKYKEIRRLKGKGIVAVSDYICSGCNMRVPSYLGKALKSKNQIILCENCGRILYYKKT